jgi:acetyl esterase/lipase
MTTIQQAAITSAPVEAPDAAGIYRIWPGNGVPPGSEDWSWGEQIMVNPWAPENGRRMVRNVVTPTLTLFKPAPGRANGTSLVIAPGGAFHFLMVDHEGYDMARAMAEIGVTCFVLKYRVMRTPGRDEDMLAFRNDLQQRLKAARSSGGPGEGPVTLEARLWGEDDGRQAIRFLRERATEFGIDPARIGIAGFSAGGAVAMGATLEHDPASRPDFACGVYPATRAGLTVPDDAPPLFLIISDDDSSVTPDSAARLYQAYHAAGKPAELHIFGNGGHGWGMAQEGHLSDIWIELFKNWLAARGLLPSGA